MRKFIYLFTLLLLFATKNSNAQFVEAQQCIGGSGNDVIVDVQKTADSGLIVLAQTTSMNGDFGDNHDTIAYALIKLNNHYEIEWEKVYNDTGSFNISSYLIQYDGNYYLRYISATNGTFSPFKYNLIRIDASGNVLWKKEYTIIDNINSSFFNFYQYYSVLAPELRVLKNNTIIFPVYKDTSVMICNIDLDGNTRWEKKYNYDTIFRDQNYGMYYLPSLISGLTDLNDSTILISNTLYSYSWAWGGNINETHLIKVDYDGNEIIENLIDSTMLYYYYNLFYYEDSSLLYYFDNSSSIKAINKNSLSVETVELLDNYRSLLNYNQLFCRSIGSGVNTQATHILYLENELDSTQSINENYLELYALENKSFIYRVLLDTGYNLNVYTVYDMPNNNYVLIYSKDGSSYISRIDDAGNIVYKKLLSPTIKTGQYATNYFNSPNGNYFQNFLTIRNHIGYDNKLYSYDMWVRDDSISSGEYSQKFFIHNLETGELEYEYDNDMRDTLLYKYIAPYPDKKNELFVLSDLNGRNTCKLGGYDIIMAKTIVATNKILGKAFIDYNNNQIKEAGEPQYNLAYLESTKGNNSISTYMNGNNFAINYVDTGTWITRLIPSHDYYEINPVSFTTSHATSGNNDTLLFAMHPTRTINDLKVSLVNSFITRLGRANTYEITYANEGTHTVTGTIKLALDNRLAFSTSNPAVTAQNGDTLIWDFSNLYLNETRKITITYNASVPPILNIGDSLHSVVFIEPVINDSTPNDNKATLDEIVRYSYDPNDKTSTSGDNITPAQIQQGNYITYVVRFQNTGNDTAFRIVVEDTLDGNLDWSTLQPINTSHPFTMQVVNKNIIQFTFSNLVLPPASINEAASHGFIAYKVKPKSELPLGSTIKNTAHIYFDFNSPVTTNTVNTHVALVSSVKNHLQGNGKISVYPNPNNGIFNLEFTADYTSLLNITLFDVTGKMVYQNQLQHHQKSIVTIDTQNLPGGMYTVVLKTDKEQLTEKIIIDK